MRVSARVGVAAACGVLGAALLVSAGTTARHRNRGVEAYPDEIEHPESELPQDSDVPAEWAFARLRYPSVGSGFWLSRSSWGIDSPKADRFFSRGVRRLTRIDARSVEEVINLEDDSVFNWPWLYAVEVGHWSLTQAQAKKIREYLLRGGFLMTDDFHGTQEWATFMASMQRVFPDRPVIDIPDGDPIFHVLYDLDHRIQVPGIQYWYSGRIYEKDGVEPHWRGIYDDKGRIMVAICHNQDNGDAWEWSDHPDYPEQYASQAYRMGINYLIYAMTH